MAFFNSTNRTNLSFNHSFPPSSTGIVNSSRSIVFGILTIPVVIIGFTGSVIFLLLLRQEKKQRLSVKATFTNLCLSTLIFCIFSGPFQAVTFIQQDRNTLSQSPHSLWCQFNAFLNGTCIFIVILCHATIAVNRFIVIVFFDHPRVITSNALLFVLLASPWLISVAVYIFPFFELGGSYGYTGNPVFKCSFLKRDKNFLTASRVLTTVLALAVIGGSYAAIWWKVSGGGRGGDAAQKMRSGCCDFMIGRFNHVEDAAGGHSVKITVMPRALRQMTKDIRVARSTFITFLVFAVCFIPSTMQAFLTRNPGDLVGVLGQSLLHLQWLGIAISPWLPVLLNWNWRNLVCRHTGQLFCGWHPTDTPHPSDTLFDGQPRTRSFPKSPLIAGDGQRRIFFVEQSTREVWTSPSA